MTGIRRKLFFWWARVTNQRVVSIRRGKTGADQLFLARVDDYGDVWICTNAGRVLYLEPDGSVEGYPDTYVWYYVEDRKSTRLNSSH